MIGEFLRFESWGVGELGCQVGREDKRRGDGGMVH